jgi:hypothetical protein
LVPSFDELGDQTAHASLDEELELTDVIKLQHRCEAQVSAGDEELFFTDTLLEYQWARDVPGLAASTLDGFDEAGHQAV